MKYQSVLARDSQPAARSIEGNSEVPSFSVAPQSATIDAGTEAHKIACQAHGNPQPSIVWKFEDDIIPIGTSKFDQTADGLIIHEPKRTDSGKYTCVARNTHGTEAISADITVIGKYFE